MKTGARRALTGLLPLSLGHSSIRSRLRSVPLPTSCPTPPRTIADTGKLRI